MGGEPILNRPFFNYNIETLETEFTRRQDDTPFLRTLLDELEYRSTQRSARLRSRVVERLSHEGGTDEGTGRPIMAAEPRATSKPGNWETEEAPIAEESPMAGTDSTEPRDEERPEFPPITNDAVSVLAAWTALEVLSPPAFRRETDRSYRR